HLARWRVRILAVDAFLGMVQDARRQAKAKDLPVWAVQADATALPLATASCDRLMANHMLYHVTDKEAALGEMRRVLKPGGRILLATNGADNGARLRDLHAEAARELGYTPAVGSPIASFTLESGLDLVRRVFPNVRVETRPDAFRFPDVESVLRYYASMGVDQLIDPPPSQETRAALVEQMRGKVQAILDREGVFRMEKTVGCFVAEKPEG
ncbi:MAG: SAM-dependent methyltransferase, partial [Caldilineae bacterium]